MYLRIINLFHLHKYIRSPAGAYIAEKQSRMEEEEEHAVIGGGEIGLPDPPGESRELDPRCAREVWSACCS
jgi:hypothetical protein